MIIRILSILLASITLAVPSWSQNFSRTEIFGGYSMTHDRINTLSGWNAQGTINLTKWIGITADFAGYYEGKTTDLGLSIWTTERSLHTFTAGPRLSYRSSKFTPFVHVLIGAARSGGTGTLTFPNFPSVPPASLSGSDYSFAMLTGGGVDVALNRRFALRPAQVDWLLIRSGGQNWHRLRYSAGIVVRF